MDIKIENFGPIAKGNINIKPLTIFIGPNNTGKSYAAILIKCLYSTFNRMMKRFAEEGDPLVSYPISYTMVKDLLRKELTYAFASDIRDIVRSGAESASFIIRYDKATVSFLYPNYEITYEEYCEDIEKLKISLKTAPPQKCHYLPAARSGILQGHRAIASAIISEAPYAVLKEIRVPTLSGITTDFIRSLMELNATEVSNKLSENGIRFIENDILKGKISAKQEKYLYPEFTYVNKRDKLSVPIHRTSSMISELAPLIIYLKYIVNRGDTIIIEEPESHLHPEMQRKIASVIALLIRNRVNVLITTHSDYLVGQISNLIRMNKLDENEKKEIGYSKEEFLNPDEVGTYLFKDNGGGTEIKTISVSDKGISQEEFVNVVDALYGEEVKIERKIMKKNNEEK